MQYRYMYIDLDKRLSRKQDEMKVGDYTFIALSEKV